MKNSRDDKKKTSERHEKNVMRHYRKINGISRHLIAKVNIFFHRARSFNLCNRVF
jgi:hypothetical protein